MSAISDCVLMMGNQGFCQQRARVEFEKASGDDLMPQTWIVTTCGNQCINSAHMFTTTPIWIEYPRGVCIYCGFPSTGKDHLQPRTITGESRRAMVALVPACFECNVLIGDRGSHNVAERRSIAHAGIQRRNKRLLKSPDWTDEQLSDYGPTLRSYMIGERQRKAGIKSRLSWPEDPFYDVRAFEKSGIGDPVALGLCNNPVIPADHYQETKPNT